MRRSRGVPVKITRKNVLLFCFIPLVFLAIGTYTLHKGYQTYSWEMGKATIVESRVVTSRDSDNNTTYNVRVHYEYLINDSLYCCDKISTGFLPYNASSSYEAEQFRKTLDVGKKVDIFYNPKDYSKAVIFRGVHYAMYLFVVLPLIFLFVIIHSYRKNLRTTF